MMPSTEATPAMLAPAVRRGGHADWRRSPAPAIALLGVAAVGLECWPNFHPGIRICVETLFGVSLWASVIVRHQRHLKCTARLAPADMKAFSRRLARSVYLLLYLLVFTRQAVLLSRVAWRGGGAALDRFQHGSMAAFDRAVFAASQPFPPFLVYGIGAIFIIHGLAALWSYRGKTLTDTSVERAGQA